MQICIYITKIPPLVNTFTDISQHYVLKELGNHLSTLNTSQDYLLLFNFANVPVAAGL